MTFDQQMEILCCGCEAIYTQPELRRKLETAAGRPLRVKLGMDPTAPDIHLGHTVVLRKLRQFQDLGHKAVLIIGDYTARIGDPTGKSQTRPMLSPEQIETNAATYFEQAGKVLDTSPDRLEIRHNSEWLEKMNFADVLSLASKKSVARMLERDTFEKRYRAGQEIGIHEFLYPLMQGWDSVCIQSDVELGGTDQTFNNLVGRDLQKLEGQEPQVVMIMPILVGRDGQEKMSKSLGNYVSVDDPADEMFGKLMSIPDELMEHYFTLLTSVPVSITQGMVRSKPRDAKVTLAKDIVSQYYDRQTADRSEREFFEKMRGGVPEDIPERLISDSELEDGTCQAYRLAVLCGFAQSNGEARRLIQEGGLRVNQEKIGDPNTILKLNDQDVVQRGKRVFVRIRLE